MIDQPNSLQRQKALSLLILGKYYRYESAKQVGPNTQIYSQYLTICLWRQWNSDILNAECVQCSNIKATFDGISENEFKMSHCFLSI